MEVRKRRRVSIAALCASTIGLVVLALPGVVRAEGCSSGDCTYYFGGGSPGTCGPYGSQCGCFQNSNPNNGQQQSSCNAPI
jgi:hypothetical protein